MKNLLQQTWTYDVHRFLFDWYGPGNGAHTVGSGLYKQTAKHIKQYDECMG